MRISRPRPIRASKRLRDRTQRFLDLQARCVRYKTSVVTRHWSERGCRWQRQPEPHSGKTPRSALWFQSSGNTHGQTGLGHFATKTATASWSSRRPMKNHAASVGAEELPWLATDRKDHRSDLLPRQGSVSRASRAHDPDLFLQGRPVSRASGEAATSSKRQRDPQGNNSQPTISKSSPARKDCRNGWRTNRLSRCMNRRSNSQPIRQAATRCGWKVGFRPARGRSPCLAFRRCKKPGSCGHGSSWMSSIRPRVRKAGSYSSTIRLKLAHWELLPMRARSSRWVPPTQTAGGDCKVLKERRFMLN